MASSLTVGTDTYISVADTTTYISGNYATTEAEYIAWTALSETNKDIFLKRACRKIDRQKFQGVKAVSTQTLEFPRAIRSKYYFADNTSFIYNRDWVTQTEVPASVKYAQVEEAIAMASGTSDRIRLQREGVKSMKLGNLSESYDKNPESFALLSQEAKELLSVYLIGAVAII